MKRKMAFVHTLFLPLSPSVIALREAQPLKSISPELILQLDSDEFNVLWEQICLPVIAIPNKPDHYERLTYDHYFEALRLHPLAKKTKVQLLIYPSEKHLAIQQSLLLLAPALKHHNKITLQQLHTHYHLLQQHEAKPCSMPFRVLQQMYQG